MQWSHKAGALGKLQLIIQDDASPEPLPEPFPYGMFEVERNPQNLGFAGNCNAGAARAKGDVILFLNQDTYALNEWFEPLLAAFADERVGIVGPKLVLHDAEGKEVIQSCGGIFDARRGPYHRFLGFAEDYWLCNQPETVSWITGAALAVRRELFAQVGGFSLAYGRGYFEDVDLCMKVKQAGYSIFYEPRAKFYHSVASTGGIPADEFRRNVLTFHTLWDAHIEPDVSVVMGNL